MSVDSMQFRRALGAFVTGVTVVTTRAANGTDIGITVNSFNSVSLDPPMVLWSLARAAGSTSAFTQSTNFAVHVLSVDQEEISRRFATRGEDKFAELTLERGAGGVPLLPACSARFECRTAFQYDGGDHIIFVGEVLSFTHSEVRPLAFHGGRYAVTSHRSWPSTSDSAATNDGGFDENFLGYLLGRAHFQFYSRIRPHVARHGLSEAEHYVLGVLINGDGRSTIEIDAILAFTGVRMTTAVVEALSARALVRSSDGSDGFRLWLTPAGRKLMIELTAVAKAAEADAQAHFNEEEIRALKRLLRNLIADTDPGLPSLWAR
jgi:3-hydroxy-9,10-secoandrosta-1,3,5(10)-triene-9,17-dione monooxygenase reductase component